MEQLSSCYFCGGALDASLSEYPVVPKQLHPDPADQGTVVLCRGCREKLAPIVERVVETARGVEEPPEAAPANRGPGETDEPAPSRRADDTAVDGETIDVGDEVRGTTEPVADAAASTDRAASDALDESDADGWDAPDAGTASESNGSGGDASADEAAAASDASAEDAADRETTEDVGGRAYTSSQAAGGRPVDGDGTVGDGNTSRTDAGGGSGGTTANDAGVADSGVTGDRAPGADDSADGESDVEADAGPSMSALEHNKVIRLLQNRDLPVDRAAFQTVALNAYDLEREEFDAILDAAVERGLIAEDDGDIVSAK